MLNRADFEESLIPPCRYFSVRGYCEVCRRRVNFQVDFSFAERTTHKRPRPNWRERLVCGHCRLPNRQRAMIDFLITHLSLDKNAQLYVAEKATPFFRALSRIYPHTIGSEMLRDGTPFGATNRRGIRNENLTRLTFSDGSLDAVCLADILEHVPQYREALVECYRCLRNGAAIIISVPFLLDARETLVRARLDENGGITHLLPPEYHGDPLDPKGVLCYYHFGWDLLDTLRTVGFGDAALYFYWSADRGYLGGAQFVIKGSKGARPSEMQRLTAQHTKTKA